MDDFGSVKYLNVQKTGSIYISAFLKKTPQGTPGEILQTPLGDGEL